MGLPMKRRPFLMALLTLGAIFLVFAGLIWIVTAFTGRGLFLPSGEKVGIIEINGVIASSRKPIEQLLEFREDSTIKAIVLRVDSPGGGVGPSQEIHREVIKTAEVKPVVASMGAVAASGGYYVIAPAQRILANPGTITGSIGVIMEFANVRELLQKIGVESEVIKSGKHKDIGSPIRALTKEDRKILQDLIEDVHLQFVTAVSEGRGMKVEEVKTFADGRIFTGRQALELGLVDELGNLQDAVKVGADLAGIRGEPQVVRPREEKPGILEYLISAAVGRLPFGRSDLSLGGLQFLWSGFD